MPTRNLLTTLLLGLALLAAAGCNSTDSSAAPVGRAFPAYPEDRQVDVYVDPSAEAMLLEGFGLTYPVSELPRDAMLMGRIDVQGRGRASSRGSWASVAEKTRGDARRLGADAVVIDDYATSIGRDRANWSDHQYRALAARAFRYRTPPQRD